MSTSDEKQLRAEILERVKAIAKLRAPGAPFVPGTTSVNYAGRVYGESELLNLVDASLDFWLTSGPWSERLEAGLAKWYGVRRAVLVNSGSSANLLAATALTSHLLGKDRLNPGDEVITVACGFPTTVAPLVQNGLVPVFVDVAPGTWNIDISYLEAARSPKTGAVMIAHTLGNPFDLGAVKAFCDKHDLWLVEDNCDAAGSLYDGKKTGTFGDLATLSFYPPHHMTTGEGGAVMTSSTLLTRVLESVRDWGRDCWCASGVDNTCKKRFGWTLGDLPAGYDHKYTYSHLGYNLKMTDLQASVGVAQLERLDGFVQARKRNWQTLRTALAPLADVLELPEPTAKSDPSWFGFFMVVKEGAPIERDHLVKTLEERKVQTRMLFGGNLTRQPALVELARQHAGLGLPKPWRIASPLTQTDRVMNRGVWVGVYPGLDDARLTWVADAVKAAFGRAG